MKSDVFKIENIFIDEDSKTQEEAFKVIANLAYTQGYVESESEYLSGLWEREKEVTTGFKDGIAIPHSKNETVIKPGMFLIKFKNPIEWNSLDGKPTTVAFGLAIPLKGAEEHLKILSKIARKLISKEFTQNLLNKTDINELYKIVCEIEL